ncbi:hypothetical protein Hanom_Chr14g01313991 [Helianthus anomalus]
MCATRFLNGCKWRPLSFLSHWRSLRGEIRVVCINGGSFGLMAVFLLRGRGGLFGGFIMTFVYRKEHQK